MLIMTMIIIIGIKKEHIEKVGLQQLIIKKKKEDK